MSADAPRATQDRMTAALEARFEKNIAQIVGRLHDIADEVERRGRATTNWTRSGDTRPDYGQAVSGVVHAVIWGVANLNLDGLVTEAAELHHFRDASAPEN